MIWRESKKGAEGEERRQRERGMRGYQNRLGAHVQGDTCTSHRTTAGPAACLLSSSFCLSVDWDVEALDSSFGPLITDCCISMTTPLPSLSPPYAFLCTEPFEWKMVPN